MQKEKEDRHVSKVTRTSIGTVCVYWCTRNLTHTRTSIGVLAICVCVGPRTEGNASTGTGKRRDTFWNPIHSSYNPGPGTVVVFSVFLSFKLFLSSSFYLFLRVALSRSGPDRDTCAYQLNYWERPSDFFENDGIVSRTDIGPPKDSVFLRGRNSDLVTQDPRTSRGPYSPIKFGAPLVAWASTKEKVCGLDCPTVLGNTVTRKNLGFQVFWNLPNNFGGDHQRTKWT